MDVVSMSYKLQQNTVGAGRFYMIFQSLGP